MPRKPKNLPSQTYKIRYRATFEAVISVPSCGSLLDAIVGVVVPEDGVSRHVHGTFEPVADAEGNVVVCGEDGTPL